MSEAVRPVDIVSMRFSIQPDGCWLGDTTTAEMCFDLSVRVRYMLLYLVIGDAGFGNREIATRSNVIKDYAQLILRSPASASPMVVGQDTQQRKR